MVPGPFLSEAHLTRVATVVDSPHTLPVILVSVATHESRGLPPFVCSRRAGGGELLERVELPSRSRTSRSRDLSKLFRRHSW